MLSKHAESTTELLTDGEETPSPKLQWVNSSLHNYNYNPKLLNDFFHSLCLNSQRYALQATTLVT